MLPQLRYRHTRASPLLCEEVPPTRRHIALNAVLRSAACHAAGTVRATGSVKGPTDTSSICENASLVPGLSPFLSGAILHPPYVAPMRQRPPPRNLGRRHRKDNGRAEEIPHSRGAPSARRRRFYRPRRRGTVAATTAVGEMTRPRLLTPPPPTAPPVPLSWCPHLAPAAIITPPLPLPPEDTTGGRGHHRRRRVLGRRRCACGRAAPRRHKGRRGAAKLRGDATIAVVGRRHDATEAIVHAVIVVAATQRVTTTTKPQLGAWEAAVAAAADAGAVVGGRRSGRAPAHP